jgi:hypothetical protein
MTCLRSWWVLLCKVFDFLWLPIFLLCLSLGLIKVNPPLIASDDIFERSIVVFKEQCEQLFQDSFSSFVTRWGNHRALSLLILKSRLRIVWTVSYRDTNAFSYKPSCKSCISINQILYLFINFGEVAVFGRYAWDDLLLNSDNF